MGFCICFLFYCVAHCTYPKDRRRVWLTQKVEGWEATARWIRFGEPIWQAFWLIQLSSGDCIWWYHTRSTLTRAYTLTSDIWYEEISWLYVFIHVGILDRCCEYWPDLARILYIYSSQSDIWTTYRADTRNPFSKPCQCWLSQFHLQSSGLLWVVTVWHVHSPRPVSPLVSYLVAPGWNLLLQVSPVP